MPAALALARAWSMAARSVDATADASCSSASSLARFFAVSRGGIRFRLGGRLPDDGVKGRASPSAGAGAGAAAAAEAILYEMAAPVNDSVTAAGAATTVALETRIACCLVLPPVLDAAERRQESRR